MAVFDDVIKLLGLTSDTLSVKAKDQLDTIITLVSGRLTAKLSTALGEKVESVPDELSGIVTEICVNRFNRIGSEGASSQSVDGESTTWFKDDYFAPYQDDIAAYVASRQNGAAGVQFL